MDIKLMHFEDLVQKSDNIEILNFSTNGLKNICLIKIYIFDKIIWVIDENENEGKDFKTKNFTIFDNFKNAIDMYLLELVLYGATDSTIENLRYELSNLNQRV